MKVALCLSGLARGKTFKRIGGQMATAGSKRNPVDWRNGFRHHQAHILNTNDVDVFFHCWDESYDQELIDAYRPKKYRFEQDITFYEPRGTPKDPTYPHGIRSKEQITVSKMYSNKEAIRLKKEYEQKKGFEYDMVMLSRFDVLWFTDVHFDQFDPESFYISNWCVMHKKSGGGVGYEDYYYRGWNKRQDELIHKHIGWPHDPRYSAVSDHWFFSNSRNMNNFGNLYDKCHKYLIAGDVPSNHEFYWKHLKDLGLLNKVKFHFHLYHDHFIDRYVNWQWRLE